MTLTPRLGFAIRKLAFDLVGIVIPETTPSAAVADDFRVALAEFDVAMASRATLIALLDQVDTMSPDTATAEMVTTLRGDIELPATPA